ncbi:MAG: T9SS type A sorting domain-containing protein [Bacteroidetes bacterium]|nr:T9SS type A sorting domain-containing protein [Bacteroidota bacterium]
MKRICLLFTVYCFLFTVSYSQLAWEPVMQTTGTNGWKTYIDGGSVRAMHVSYTNFPPLLFYGGEFDTIRWDSASVHLAGELTPFLALNIWGNFIGGGGSDCNIGDYTRPNPSVYAITNIFDTIGFLDMVAAAGWFGYEACPFGTDEFPKNIALWSGSQSANYSYLFSENFSAMDTVFAIAMAPDKYTIPKYYGNFETYVAARCVFCNGTSQTDSSKYIGYYDQFNGNSMYNYMQGGTNGPVYALQAVDSANVFAGGVFDSAGTIKAMNIAKWNGASWDSLGSGVNGTVKALLAYNGKLYAGGNFTMAGGASANNIAVWDGTNWSAIGTGTDGTVYALTIHNGELYAGGSFTQAGGNTVNNIARWDGINWSALDGGRNNEVYALASFQGDLYAGGNFLGGANDTARYIARYTDTTLVSINSQFSSLDFQFSIYPNPTSGLFNVQMSKFEDVQMKIYNVYGECIYQHICTSAHQQIDLSSQPDGIYFVQLKTAEGVANKKIVISH